MLTKAQILEELEKTGIRLGKNPSRTFNYYRQIGLLPERCGYANKNTALYPTPTLYILKRIKALQQKGCNLSEIKKRVALGRNAAAVYVIEATGVDPEEVADAKHALCVVGMYHLLVLWVLEHKVYLFKLRHAKKFGALKFAAIQFNIPSLDFEPTGLRLVARKTLTRKAYTQFLLKAYDRHIRVGKDFPEEGAIMRDLCWEYLDDAPAE